MEIQLEEGEVVCDNCNGLQYIYEDGDTQWKDMICKKCDGDGKLNWIEAIKGKRKKSNIIINSGFEIWNRNTIKERGIEIYHGS